MQAVSITPTTRMQTPTVNNSAQMAHVTIKGSSNSALSVRPSISGALSVDGSTTREPIRQPSTALITAIDPTTIRANITGRASIREAKRRFNERTETPSAYQIQRSRRESMMTQETVCIGMAEGVSQNSGLRASYRSSP
jgi:hypothetical protein